MIGEVVTLRAHRQTTGSCQTRCWSTLTKLIHNNDPGTRTLALNDIRGAFSYFPSTTTETAVGTEEHLESCEHYNCAWTSILDIKLVERGEWNIEVFIHAKLRDAGVPSTKLPLLHTQRCDASLTTERDLNEIPLSNAVSNLTYHYL